MKEAPNTSTFAAGNQYLLTKDAIVAKPLEFYKKVHALSLNGEMECELFSKLYRVPTVRLRYFTVYGPNDAPSSRINQILAHSPISKIGLLDGDDTVRDFVHVDDVCEANTRAMNDIRLRNHTINVGTGISFSVKQIAEMISKQRVVGNMGPPICSTERLEALMGWKPKRSIIQKCIEAI